MVKLKLDALRVQSFSTQEAPAGRGTVAAHASGLGCTAFCTYTKELNCSVGCSVDTACGPNICN